MSEITELLDSAKNGDREALGRVCRLLYDDLRRMARARLGRMAPGQSIAPTDLVHEALLRVYSSEEASWSDRAHFLRVAGTVMRRVLVDRSRTRQATKRGGGAKPLSLDDAVVVTHEPSEDLVVIDELLGMMSRIDEVAVDVVQLRYFVGLEVKEVADVLDIPPRRVERKWTWARSWLRRRLRHADEEEAG